MNEWGVVGEKEKTSYSLWDNWKWVEFLEASSWSPTTSNWKGKSAFAAYMIVSSGDCLLKYDLYLIKQKEWKEIIGSRDL